MFLKNVWYFCCSRTLIFAVFRQVTFLFLNFNHSISGDYGWSNNSISLLLSSTPAWYNNNDDIRLTYNRKWNDSPDQAMTKYNLVYEQRIVGFLSQAHCIINEY